MSKSLLVIGGTGVISYAIVLEAIKQGYDVTCINRGKTKSQSLPSEVEVLKSDYRDEKRITQLLKGRMYDAVLDVLCFRKEDIDYSISLFKDHCKQYFFFSSAEAYNKPKYENSVCNEDAELVNPLWSYSINKAACEEELRCLAEKYHVTYTIVRPAITYGNTRIPYGVMPPYGYHGTIIHRLLHHKPIITWDGGKANAVITRVEDFAFGFVGLIGNEKAYNQAFHISGDENHSWKEVIDILASQLDVSPVYVDVSSSTLGNELLSLKEQIVGGRAISQRLDNSKMKDAVPGFKTNIPLEEGIKMTVDYYQKNNYLYGIDWQFDGDMDRIAAKYDKSYRPVFVDYLSNATKEDQLRYNRALKRNITIERLKLYAHRQLNSVKRKIKKYISK